MLENTMIGILRAKNNIELASQNQLIASSFIGAGKVRVKEGLLSGNEDAIKEGEELQAKGEEIKADTFEHLGNAMNDLNSDINVVAENSEELQISSENAPENQEHVEGEPDTVAANTVKVSVKNDFYVPNRIKLDINV
ncbi:MAG: hypothetical protein FWD34_05055 [Oscillospiraceae bacterium]|nr:hypothetical protein [Oscillospiraceae bacterium]